MAKITVVVTGVPAIDRRLRRVEGKVGRKVVRRALRRGAKLVAQEAKRRAPRRTGALSKSIKVRAGKRSRRAISINAIIGKGFFKGETFYAGFIEFGAPGHMTYGRGRSPLKPNPFMRAAFDTAGPRARDLVLREILQGLETAARG